MSVAEKCLVLDTCDGRIYCAVKVVGQTPKNIRVRVLAPEGVTLPSRRHVKCGELVLVPKRAICDMPGSEP